MYMGWEASQFRNSDDGQRVLIQPILFVIILKIYQGSTSGWKPSMRREFWHQRIFAVYSFLQFRLSTIASSYSVNSIHLAFSVGCNLKMPGQCQVRLVLMFFCLVYVVYHPFIHFVCCQQWRAIHSALSRMQAENELLWCARWGALCTISGLGGHRTPSAAEAHCSNNALMYKTTMRWEYSKVYCIAQMHKFTQANAHFKERVAL